MKGRTRSVAWAGLGALTQLTISGNAAPAGAAGLGRPRRPHPAHDLQERRPAGAAGLGRPRRPHPAHDLPATPACRRCRPGHGLGALTQLTISWNSGAAGARTAWAGLGALTQLTISWNSGLQALPAWAGLGALTHLTISWTPRTSAAGMGRPRRPHSPHDPPGNSRPAAMPAWDGLGALTPAGDRRGTGRSTGAAGVGRPRRPHPAHVLGSRTMACRRCLLGRASANSPSSQFFNHYSAANVGRGGLTLKNVQDLRLDGAFLPPPWRRSPPCRAFSGSCCRPS